MSQKASRDEQISELRVRIANLEQQLIEARTDLKILESLVPGQQASLEEKVELSGTSRVATVSHSSSPEEKLTLFRTRFQGRDDAFAYRWENQAKGTKGWAPKTKYWVAPKDVKEGDLKPLTNGDVTDHLSVTAPGARPLHMGLYPLTKDDHCYLLACDFDKGDWQKDAFAYAAAARAEGFDTLTEISRSGNGAHVWTFFSEKVPAVHARALGARLIRSAMELRAGMPLSSYDRLFPSQDTIPLKSTGQNRLGNLIALPLEGDARQSGRTVFVDPSDFSALPDQFAALDAVVPASAEKVTKYLRRIGEEAIGPRVSLADDLPRRRSFVPRRLVDNEPLAITRDHAVHIPLEPLPGAVVSELKHLASQHNPEFYRRQAQRRSTFGVPRLVQCFEVTDTELILPRGVLDEVRKLLKAVGFRVTLKYRGVVRTKLGSNFLGDLREVQREAFDAMTPHREGVIVAPTGTGKTVIACALIGKRNLPTVILVNNTQLLSQWRESLERFLDLKQEDIGQLGDGKRNLTGKVDLVMTQSIRGRNADLSVLNKYGQVIVDECHSIGAPSTLAAVEQLNAAYWVGLTATPYRADELNGLITMQCGPIRYDADSLLAATRELHAHTTRFESEIDQADGADLQEMYNELAADKPRNRQIAEQVIADIREGRHGIVLTNRTNHIEQLSTLLRESGLEAPCLELHGKLGKKERQAIRRRLADVDAAGLPYVILASDKIAGEGFNLPSLDTLYLVSPVSFKGKIEQLIGRIQRTDDAERVIRVHDYVDAEVPVFLHMARRRHRVIQRKGFRLVGSETVNV